MTVTWAIRSAMVATAAVVAYLLVQTDLTLEPLARVILGAIAVALAALNPASLSDRLRPPA